MFVSRFLGIAALLGAFTGSAAASQTLTCTIEEQDLTFDFQGALGSPANARLNGARGQLEWKARGGRPEVKIEISPEILAQEWIVGSELRLRFYRDSEGGRPEVDLIVTAARARESTYRGRYSLAANANGKDWKRSGRILCELEY
jgi:hypothetical protein